MMSDLLVQLARIERETHLEHDPRWDALSSGALPPSERAALQAAAARQGKPELVEAFSPFDAAAHERLTQHASWLLQATSGHFSPATPGISPRGSSSALPRVTAGSPAPATLGISPRGSSSALPRVTSGSPTRTTPRPISRVRRVTAAPEAERPSRGAFAGALAVAFCAAAAAIVLFIRMRPDPVEVVTSAARSIAALPKYILEVSGGDAAAAVRSAAGDAPLAEGSVDMASAVTGSTLGAGTPLAIVLRPETPVIDAVDLRACVRRGDGIQPWSPLWERSEQGSFRVEGTRESLFPGEPPGELTLLFAIAPAGELPSCDVLGLTAPDGVVIRSHRVVLR